MYVAKQVIRAKHYCNRRNLNGFKQDTYIFTTANQNIWMCRRHSNCRNICYSMWLFLPIFTNSSKASICRIQGCILKTLTLLKIIQDPNYPTDGFICLLKTNLASEHNKKILNSIASDEINMEAIDNIPENIAVQLVQNLYSRPKWKHADLLQTF